LQVLDADHEIGGPVPVSIRAQRWSLVDITHTTVIFRAGEGRYNAAVFSECKGGWRLQTGMSAQKLVAASPLAGFYSRIKLIQWGTDEIVVTLDTQPGASRPAIQRFRPEKLGQLDPALTPTVQATPQPAVLQPNVTFEEHVRAINQYVATHPDDVVLIVKNGKLVPLVQMLDTE
jgi:hypothetical protein